MQKRLLTFLSILCSALVVSAQEYVVPLTSQCRWHSKTDGNDTAALQLPFFDDFSNYTGSPRSANWSSRHAFVNTDYAPQSPTIGMVTLDAIDAAGNLYAHASSSKFPADTLLSRTIRLDSVSSPVRRRLSAADSIALSFYYLPGGWYGPMWERVGDGPGTEDSLILEFYNFPDDRWERVWSVPGFAVDTAGLVTHWPWRYAYVKIADSRFLNRHFRFRFRNLASFDSNPKYGMVGNGDQWNIDYVYLDYKRTAADSLQRDVAFVGKAPSMLKLYQAMPYRQFASSDMADSLNIGIVNRYRQTLASTYSFSVFDESDSNVYTYDGGYENIVSFYPSGQYQRSALHASPHPAFSFPQLNAPRRFTVEHVVTEGVGGDLHRENDTMRFTQIFDNYYAYDDGTPENGFGVNTSGSVSYTACRFDLRVADTLTAVDLFFNRTRGGENEHVPFSLCVWSNDNGRPGTLLYSDEQTCYPEFEGMNRYHRYPLSRPLRVKDTVFVGFVQRSSAFINLGFDRGTDSRQMNFSRYDADWHASFLRGSLMLRPVFGKSDVAGILSSGDIPQVSIVPNPVHNSFSLRGVDGLAAVRYTIFDMQGRPVRRGTYSGVISSAGIEPGLYVLRIESDSAATVILKLIVGK